MESIERWLKKPGAKVLKRLGLTPNQLSFLGIPLAIIVGVLILSGAISIWIGGVLFLLGSLTDFFDGALARLTTGHDEKFGARWDIFCDKLVELIQLVTVYNLVGNPAQFLTVTAIATMIQVALVKIQAQNKELQLEWSEVMVLGHPGRVVILTGGMVLTRVSGHLQATLFLMLLSLVTFNTICLVQRCWKIAAYQKRVSKETTRHK